MYPLNKVCTKNDYSLMFYVLKHIYVFIFDAGNVDLKQGDLEKFIQKSLSTLVTEKLVLEK